MVRRFSTLERLKLSPRVEHLDDERQIGNGLIVTLKQGWSFDPRQDNRVAGADSVRELRSMICGAHPFSGPYTD